jgi:polyferredoxin
MLRKIRVSLAVICFTLISLLFLDFTGTLHLWFGWLARVQLFPALLALHSAIVGALVVLTLVFGRIYCSVLCPLGVFQDIVARGGGKNRYAFRPALAWLRHVMLAFFVLAVAAGIPWVTALLEPYSAFGRMASTLGGPVYQWGNNLLAYVAERMDSYTFYPVEVWVKSTATLAVALLSLVLLGGLAWKNGRSYCNSVCPVGTVLGFLARFSLFKPRIDQKACLHCGLCARSCKASCIDDQAGKIDYSRCVMCFDCLGTCQRGALTYGLPVRSVQEAASEEAPNGPGENSRRRFLSLSTLFAVALAAEAQARSFDGGLALIQDKQPPQRTTPIVPPGALSLQHFRTHCTGCQLCVSVCPNQVLRPAGGLAGLTQPQLSYERGYCRPECTKCSEVCPTAAIQPVTAVEKSSIQIGHAVWIRDFCVVRKDRVRCDNCARHCPTGAIRMAPQDPHDPKSLGIPMIDVTRCIGCGACENLCPSRPYSAIYVEGHERHQLL